MQIREILSEAKKKATDKKKSATKKNTTSEKGQTIGDIIKKSGGKVKTFGDLIQWLRSEKDKKTGIKEPSKKTSKAAAKANDAEDLKAKKAAEQAARTAEAVKEIMANCSEFLSVFRAGKIQPLWRGRSYDDARIVRKSFAGREPKDSPLEMQRAVDQTLKAAGFTALRGNSVYTSGDPNFADTYGHLYYIFPMNGFSITWSPLIIDFYSDFFEDFGASNDAWLSMFYYCYKLSLLKKKLAAPSRRQLRQAATLLGEDLDRFSSRLIDLEYTLDSSETRTPAVTAMNKFVFEFREKIDWSVELSETQLASLFNKSYARFNALLAKMPKNIAAAIAKSGIDAEFKNFISFFAADKQRYTPMITQLLGFKNTDLAAAIASKNEILFTGKYFGYAKADYPNLMQALNQAVAGSAPVAKKKTR